ncbi:unnamed protein product [Arabidopsis lyrata]|nr:unnamed protein product [Arabidopsis lyrata]
MCTSLVELPSAIGNLHKLQELQLQGCSKLAVLPTNINLESLAKLNLSDCLMLKSFPEISTNIKHLKLMRTAIKEVPLSIKSWSRLHDLEMSYNENLQEFSHALDIITKLHYGATETQEIPSWINKISHLKTLILESLETLGGSFHNHSKKFLKFINCLKLNKEARELIQTSSTRKLLPSREVPANLTYPRDAGSFLMVSLNQRPFSTTLIFKACILLVKKNDKEKEDDGREIVVYYDIMEKHKAGVVPPAYRFIVPPFLREHLLTFELETEVTSNELIFKFHLGSDEVVIKEYGVLQL